ncbi:hypothetical protein CHUAL_009144 [Chamberlinius hualienensis]
MANSQKFGAFGYNFVLTLLSLVNCEVFNFQEKQIQIFTSTITNNFTGRTFNNDAAYAPKPQVNLTVHRVGGQDTIFAEVHWQKINAPIAWMIKKYQLRINATGSNRCLKDFHQINVSRNKHENYYIIPASHTPPHELKYRCNYSLELEVVSHNESILNTAKEHFYIPDCINKTCECKILAVQNVTATLQPFNLSTNTRQVLIEWNYPIPLDNVTQIEHFSVKYHPKQPDAVRTVPYINNVTGYSTKLGIRNKDPSKFTVIAHGRDGCKSVAASVQNELNDILNNTLIGVPNETSINSSESHTYTGIALLSGALAVTAAASIVVLLKKRFLRNQQRLRSLPKNLVNYKLNFSDNFQSSYLFTRQENVNTLYVEQEIQEALDKGLVDHYEISHSRLKIEKEIGKGAFGKVFAAAAEGITGYPNKITVAVKYLKDSPSEQEKDEFLREIYLMKRAGHHRNVIHMIACCTIQEPICMVMEYIEYGDLLNYLKKLRSEYQRIVSSDLTFSNQLTRPISDPNVSNGSRSFTLSIKDLNKENSMGDSSSAPPTTGSESSEITTATSVYDDSINSCYKHDSILDSKQLINFAMQISNGMMHLGNKGIVHRDLAARNVLIGVDKVLKISDFGLSRTGVYVTRRGGKVPLRWLSIEAIRDSTYQLFNVGGVPYASVADRDVYTFLLHGKRLERPSLCSEKLYDVMTQCWNEDPKSRPTFQQLFNILSEMEVEAHEYVNFNHTENLLKSYPTDVTA